MADQRWQANLHKTLVDHLDEGEARILCYDLGIDYGRLDGANKSDKLNALLEFCHRHRITRQLVGLLHSQCPDVTIDTDNMPDSRQEERARLELHVKADIISFGNQQQAELVQTIAEMFDIEQGSIHLLTQATSGVEVHVVLGMRQPDADRLARPAKKDARFDKLYREHHVQLIQLHTRRLGHGDKLSAYRSHGLHGTLRFLFYLGSLVVLWLCGFEFASLLLPDSNAWGAFLFKLPSAETARFYLVAWLVTLPGLAAWIGLPIILAKFVQTVHTIGDLRQTFDYFFLGVFGPLFLRYPAVTIQEGQIALKDRATPQGSPDGPGGPCLYIIFNDSAIVTERAGRRIAVLGPSIHKAQRFEKIYQTLDLRPQTRSVTAACITRDGIPIQAQVSVTYRIRWKGEPSAQFPYPVDPDALLQAAAGQQVVDVGQGKQVQSWADRVGDSPSGELRTIIARYRLDELIESHDPGLKPRAALIRQLKEALRRSAADLGAEVLEVHLDAFEFEPELQSIKQQWMDTWRAGWEKQIRLHEAQVQASAMHTKEIAHAYAQLEMLAAITREFQPATDNSLPADVIVARVVGVIGRMAANPESASLLPHEARQTLEGMQKLLQEASQKPAPQDQVGEKLVG